MIVEAKIRDRKDCRTMPVLDARAPGLLVGLFEDLAQEISGAPPLAMA